MSPHFRFNALVEVRFRDLDALGHVNNAVYLTYFEIARTHYWKNLFGLPRAAQNWGFVMVRTECNYRSPAILGETIKISARILSIKNSSFSFEYRLVENQTGRLIAEGLSIQVCYNQKTGKTIYVPKEIRKKIHNFEGME